MRYVVKWCLKLILAAFAAVVCAIAVVLPYEARKRYIQAWLRFEHTVTVIF
jgi:hypothetical protein